MLTGWQRKVENSGRNFHPAGGEGAPPGGSSICSQRSRLNWTQGLTAHQGLQMLVAWIQSVCLLVAHPWNLAWSHSSPEPQFLLLEAVDTSNPALGVLRRVS